MRIARITSLVIAVVSGCEGGNANEDEGTEQASITANCGPRPPSPGWCSTLVCDGDGTWDIVSKPAGVSCNGTGKCDGNGTCVTPAPPAQNHTFYFHGLGNRCWDLGPPATWASGTPAQLAACNSGTSQKIEVQELDSWRDVQLHVPGTTYCLGVRGGAVVSGRPLELQTCNGSPGQRFALDGDSVLVGTQVGPVSRDHAIAPLSGVTVPGTPLVVELRQASSQEWFNLQSIDGSSTPPTSGWVRVQRSTTGAPDAALVAALAGGWGTVIEIAMPQLTITETRFIPAGVTVRGIRTYSSSGPTINFGGSSAPMFVAAEDNVRITGLRLLDGAGDAIKVVTDHGQRVLIDNIEASGWTGIAVDVHGGDEPPDGVEYPEQARCDAPGTLPMPRATDVRIVNSFIHDNGGYGIATGNGAFIKAQRNVLYKNVHSITADPWRRTGYIAYENLILDHPIEGTPETSNQDFDSHGSGGRLEKTFEYGIAGDYFDVAYNTFLQHDHFNWNLRGTPCRPSQFRNNFSSRTLPVLSRQLGTPTMLDNTVGISTDINRIAAGDFDGDGMGDLFYDTGVTWWFSSGATTQWRFLNRMRERASELTFGDFDGDGRTDVRTVQGGTTLTSWGGVSRWQ